MEFKNIVATIYLRDGLAYKNATDTTGGMDVLELAQKYDDSGIDKIICFDLSNDDDEHEKNILAIREINRSIDAVPSKYKLRIAAWNGIIFNAVGIWAVSGFQRPIDQLAAELTEITMHLYDAEVAAAFDPHL